MIAYAKKTHELRDTFTDVYKKMADLLRIGASLKILSVVNICGCQQKILKINSMEFRVLQ
jgi:CRISPR/Cas system-associated protein Cas5 (RAMP superfamily)